MTSRYLAGPLIAHLVFFGLVAVTWYQGYVSGTRALTFLTAWIVGAGAVAFAPSLYPAFTASVAIFCIIHILMVYKRDIPLD